MLTRNRIESIIYGMVNELLIFGMWETRLWEMRMYKMHGSMDGIIEMQCNAMERTDTIATYCDDLEREWMCFTHETIHGCDLAIAVQNTVDCTK